jgi:hypothetical protein
LPSRSSAHFDRKPRRRLSAFAIAVWLCVTASPYNVLAQKLQLTNPLNVDRASEVVEVPLTQVMTSLHLTEANLESLVAIDAKTKKRIPSQLYSYRNGLDPDTLLLLVQLPAHGSMNISFKVDPKAPVQLPLVFGREAPERKDDFAWENEVVAYRVYGPTLQATGEIASGIDVWSKRIPNFVIDSFYKRDAEGARTHNPDLSYHKDNGQGLDSYLVGPSRGCGGTGVWADGQLWVSKNYTFKRILANGPIRFTFELKYDTWNAAGRTVVETKVIMLDAGSHMNRIDSAYTFIGQTAIELAAGLAIHSGAEVSFPAGDNIASVWDTPQDPSAGRIATGIVALPEEKPRTLKTADNILMIFERQPGETFTYYAGSGWSKADMKSQADWNGYLTSFLEFREHPITAQWTKK